MRLGVLTTQTPFIIGGAERHAANLVAALKARGFEACEISIPFKPFPGRVLAESLMAAKLIDLSDLGYPVDRVVGLKFPAYLVRHPDKYYWILHQHRQVYDMWEAGVSELQQDPDGLAVRELIRAEDRSAFSARDTQVFANSQNVAARMQRHLGITSTPLYHPPPNAERLRVGPYGDYLFAPSRLGPSKRQTLMIEALTHAPSARLVLAGPPDRPGYDATLAKLARERGVADRVEILGAISDERMIRLYAGARAVVFVPVDEDYGYITLEAMLSARPVITATDAGGPLEFIADAREGLVVEPTPAALGAAFERVSTSPKEAERWGQAGHAAFQAKGITWDAVVAALTGEQRSVLPDAAPPRPEARAPDLKALAGLLAPPTPANPPFESLDALLKAYDFATVPGFWAPRAEADKHPYLASHWRRYLATLAMIEDVDGAYLLDVGVSPPFVFQAMLARQRPNAAITGIWSERHPHRQRLVPQRAGLEPVEIAVHPANVEREALPFGPASQDLVLAMEIVEHFAVDPFHFFSEANRVLRPGGHLLITTPNMSSHRSVAKILAGNSPYSFGLFVPVGGVHGRHNREYVPREVAILGEAAGFSTVRLCTADVYDDHIDPAAAAVLTARDDDFSMRGETILWLGRKTGTPGPAPEAFYHGRPEQLSGRLSLARREGDTLVVRADNTSRRAWVAEGPFAMTLSLDWIDAHGTLVHPSAQIELPHGVPPGESAEIALVLGGDGALGTLRIGLFEAGAGPLAGAGRGAPLALPCTEAAFLALARP
ncbi:MAG: glycosyltransferase [Pseudomonadota bacterium]